MKSSKKKLKVIVFFPAYNAEKTLKRTFNEIPKKAVDRFILVDDGSHDKTVVIAKKLGIETFIHPQNRGYGANQKSGYTLAINAKADIIVMVHPDYQYDGSLVGELIYPIIQNRFDIMLGSRIRTRKEALQGGMPLYKYIANRLLTTIQNIILGQNLSEYHTGLRAFKSDVLVKLPYHKFSDDFVFDQEILIAALKEGNKIGEIPVPVRYFKEASSINFRQSTKYGIQTLFALLKYILSVSGIYTSKIFMKNDK